jgi:CHAD domain-containing protein
MLDQLAGAKNSMNYTRGAQTGDGGRGAFVRSAMNRQYELELRTLPSHAGDMRFGLPENLPVLLPPQISDGQPATGLDRAQKASPSLLPVGCKVADAFRLTLVQCRWHVAANAAVFVESREPEAIHQLRVGLRRLRVALTSFGGEFRTPQFEGVRLRAKDLAQQLAPARDLDVFVSELLEPVAGANGSQDAFSVLRRRAQEARCRAFDDAFAAMAGPRLRMFMRETSDIADGRGWTFPPYQQTALNEVHAYQRPAQSVAERILAHRYKKACKGARHLEKLSTAERHALRIELKKLRYAAEFFVPLFDAAQTKKFLGRLSRMQDVLGAVNDVAVAKSILGKLVSSPGHDGLSSDSELSFAAGLVYGWHLDRAAHKWREAVSRWKKFARTRVFWDGAASRP